MCGEWITFYSYLLVLTVLAISFHDIFMVNNLYQYVFSFKKNVWRSGNNKNESKSPIKLFKFCFTYENKDICVLMDAWIWYEQSYSVQVRIVSRIYRHNIIKVTRPPNRGLRPPWLLVVEGDKVFEVIYVLCNNWMLFLASLNYL